MILLGVYMCESLTLGMAPHYLISYLQCKDFNITYKKDLACLGGTMKNTENQPLHYMLLLA